MSDVIESHITVESADASPVDLLRQASGLSKQRVKFAMTQGAVWLTRGRNTQRLRRASRKLREGDELHLYYDAAILAQVRRHLARQGHPVIGDRRYGHGDEDGVDLQLTAWRLAFHCPVADAPVVYQLDARAQWR